ncbi:hypothetical protein DBR47_24170 [Paucibacter sp. KBW04]|uniref:DUF932 domain-containing protein n=1 Tax=Paucibacter sp. KBW04 TaxID=2153361 RepID=UPI000F5613BD|nr:DUF932 domain-containing protein [Paucibacter sp. KBW04]RQO53411.1 hypothetical protein DBR47_24170 [Paucibacter sp. KBW04]
MFPFFRVTAASSLTAARALTDAELRRVAPSVFAEAAHDSRSARYAYIATAEILAGLRKEGFEVFSARQSRCRSEDRSEHTKHLLRLRHISQVENVAKVGDSVGEIVLLNSHDGSSSYQMMGGMFRFICSNGMVVPEGVCQTVKVHHAGKVQDKVVAGAYEVLDGLTRVIESRDEMRGIVLSSGEQQAFAQAALGLRFDLPEGQAAPVSAEQLLRPRRQEDGAADLWSTFNRVQENSVKGGLQGRLSNGVRRSTRAVTGIDQDVKLNRALWTLAEEMRRLKA